jgi:hypothetical protein
VGAIAVSEKEERRAALITLEEKVEKERLRQEIQDSVRRCAKADKEENRQLLAGAVASLE